MSFVPRGLSAATFQAGVAAAAGGNVRQAADDVAAALLADAERANIVSQEELEAAAAALIAMPEDGGGRVPQELAASAGGAIQNAARKHGSARGYRMASAGDDAPLTEWRPSEPAEALRARIQEIDDLQNTIMPDFVGPLKKYYLMPLRFAGDSEWGFVLRGTKHWDYGTAVTDTVFRSVEIFGEQDEFARVFMQDGRLLVFSMETGRFLREERLVASGLLSSRYGAIGVVAVMRDDGRWNFLRHDGRPEEVIEVEERGGSRRYLVGGSVYELVILRKQGKLVSRPPSAVQPSAVGHAPAAASSVPEIAWPRSHAEWMQRLAETWKMKHGAIVLYPEWRNLIEEAGGSFTLEKVDASPHFFRMRHRETGTEVLVQRDAGGKEIFPLANKRVFTSIKVFGGAYVKGTTLEGEEGIFSASSGARILEGDYDIVRTADGVVKLVKRA